VKNGTYPGRHLRHEEFSHFSQKLSPADSHVRHVSVFLFMSEIILLNLSFSQKFWSVSQKPILDSSPTGIPSNFVLNGKFLEMIFQGW
jgi:hypothetical protein